MKARDDRWTPAATGVQDFDDVTVRQEGAHQTVERTRLTADAGRFEEHRADHAQCTKIDAEMIRCQTGAA
jgi:NADPH-dependent 7-cyano-7-deazaguanine reductase QueF